MVNEILNSNCMKVFCHLFHIFALGGGDGVREVESSPLHPIDYSDYYAIC